MLRTLNKKISMIVMSLRFRLICLVFLVVIFDIGGCTLAQIERENVNYSPDYVAENARVKKADLSKRRKVSRKSQQAYVVKFEAQWKMIYQCIEMTLKTEGKLNL